MRYARITALILFTSLCCVGCGPKKPDGIPKLLPTYVTIVKDSNPVKDANVFLVPGTNAPSGSWSIMGVTDDAGKATIETSQGEWKAPGAPEGEYKVYLTKLAAIEEPEKPTGVEEGGPELQEYYAERLKRLEEASKEIPKEMTQAETSGLTVTVASGTGANETLDISVAE